MELDGCIPQRHVPAGPDPLGQRLGNPLGQAPELIGAADRRR